MVTCIVSASDNHAIILEYYQHSFFSSFSQSYVVFSILATPSCPINTTSTRNTDFTAATVTWSQPPNSPPVPTTTVTYCPTSSPNCGNSTTCTSPCTISGLNPCVNYSLTVTPSNNCGSATGCTTNTVDSPSQGQYDIVLVTAWPLGE